MCQPEYQIVIHIRFSLEINPKILRFEVNLNLEIKFTYILPVQFICYSSSHHSTLTLGRWKSMLRVPL